MDKTKRQINKPTILVRDFNHLSQKTNRKKEMKIRKNVED